MIEIDRKEAYRYMGYGRNLPDEAVIERTEKCIALLNEAAVPKKTYRRYSMEIRDGKIYAGGLVLESKALLRNLSGCREVIFFAATLGSGVDLLLNRFLKLQVSDAVIFQAVAAAGIESFVDSCQKEIEKELKKEGLFVRPRFSPGYGDLPLSVQADFLNCIEASKYAGITLTEGDIMLPEKSVSAIMGITKENPGCQEKGCMTCTKTDCLYRLT